MDTALHECHIDAAVTPFELSQIFDRTGRTFDIQCYAVFVQDSSVFLAEGVVDAIS